MPALWLQDTDFWLLSLWKCKPLSCVWFLATQWTVACQAPLSRNYLGKNAGVDSHFLLQGIFLTQGSNPGLLWCRQILYHLKREVAQSCPTLWDPMNCSLLGSSLHEIFQARVLEWVVISFSRGSSWPRDLTRISCVSCIEQADSLPTVPLGKPPQF